MAFPADQMCESVLVHRRAGVNGYGEPVMAGDVVESWYLEPGFKIVTDARGEEVVSSLFGIGPADSALMVGHEITWDNRRYRAIDAQPVRSGGAADHVEAYFKSVVEAS